MKWWGWFTVGFDLACLGCWLEAGTLSVGRMLFLVMVMLAIVGCGCRYNPDQVGCVK